MADEKTAKTGGTMTNDTKNTRKYNTEWGVIYLPLGVVERIGSPTRVEFTVTNADDA